MAPYFETLRVRETVGRGPFGLLQTTKTVEYPKGLINQGGMAEIRDPKNQTIGQAFVDKADVLRIRTAADVFVHLGGGILFRALSEDENGKEEEGEVTIETHNSTGIVAKDKTWEVVFKKV